MTRQPRIARLALVSCAVVLAACAKTEKAPADTVSAAMPEPTTATASGAMATPIALADVAGTWKMRATPTSGADKTTTEYTLVATAEPGGWKATFANGLTVPARVSAAGDSIIFDMGPYKSVRRKGVDVTTHGVFRKQGDKMVGTTTAHYNVKTADSTLTLSVEGTKAP